MANADKAEKISITLPSDMLRSIKDRVSAGTYGSTSEVIREAMRLWQRQEDEHAARIDTIRARLSRSANSGAPVPLDDAFEQLAARHLAAGSNEDL